MSDERIERWYGRQQGVQCSDLLRTPHPLHPESQRSSCLWSHRRDSRRYEWMNKYRGSSRLVPSSGGWSGPPPEKDACITVFSDTYRTVCVRSYKGGGDNVSGYSLHFYTVRVPKEETRSLPLRSRPSSKMSRLLRLDLVVGGPFTQWFR